MDTWARASVNSDFSEALHPDSRTLYTESGNRSKRRGIEDSRNRIRGTGWGCGESVVVVLQRRCFSSELRVITLNN